MSAFWLGVGTCRKKSTKAETASVGPSGKTPCYRQTVVHTGMRNFLNSGNLLKNSLHKRKGHVFRKNAFSHASTYHMFIVQIESPLLSYMTQLKWGWCCEILASRLCKKNILFLSTLKFCQLLENLILTCLNKLIFKNISTWKQLMKNK